MRIVKGLVAGVFVSGLAVAALAQEPIVLTVGPGGTYATIQAGVDAAGALTDPVEIRIAPGTYVEDVRFSVPAGRSVTISGGWTEAFSTNRRREGLTTASYDPGDPSTNTVVRALLNASVLGASCEGTLVIRGLTLTGGGGADGEASGLFLSIQGDGAVQVSENAVWNNHATHASVGRGFGNILSFVEVWLRDRGSLTLTGNLFRDNVVEVTGADGWVIGGAFIHASGESRARIAGNLFLHNEARANRADYAALDALAEQDARIDILRNVFTENRSLSTGTAGHGPVRLRSRSGDGVGPGRPRIVASSNWFLRNNVSGAASPFQIEVQAAGDGTVVVSDSVVDGSNAGGIVADAAGKTSVFLTNLSVVRNQGIGVAGHGPAHLDNSIVFMNGTNSTGTLVGSHNLEDDPDFVDLGRGDYHVMPGSPAIDAGSNAAPELGVEDLYRAPRILGTAVDIGAAESGSGPSCAVLRPIAGPETAVCRCVSDPGLRATRCGVLDLPDLMLSLRIPFAARPGEPVPARWTIDPGPGVRGPFRMSAELRIGEKWTPQPWVTRGKPVLIDGRPTLTNFILDLPAAGTALRTRLDYTRPGRNKPEPVDIEILLPKR
jgi:hypothetical protein